MKKMAARKRRTTNLTLAFREMRRRGLSAHQNYWCCQTCGGIACTEEAANKVWQGKEVLGCVYYHAQDAQARRAGLDFGLAYGQMHDKDLGAIGVIDQAVGKIVCECLEQSGIGYSWNGDPARRIKVTTSTINKVKTEFTTKRKGQPKHG